MILVTKKRLQDSASWHAQGGIAAVLDPKDSFESHIEDTLRAGHHKNKKSAVEKLVKEAPAVIKHLESLGVKFDRDLRKEGCHSYRRIVHIADHTGKTIIQALIRAVKKEKNIKILENTQALKLLKQKGKIIGITLSDEQKIYAKATVLTTGGIGQKFPHTTNPKVSTGDGIDMAKKAGAKLMDMEYMQFHPTVLNAPGKPKFMLSESLRGEGARIVTENGKRFVDELAPRDIICAAVNKKIEQEHKIYLDITHKKPDWIKKHFPYITKTLKKHGFNLAKDRIPIAPAAHYLCGGIATDLQGRTSLPGLYAYGEVARTGAHGRNRLASNSLLEGLVFTMEIPKELQTLQL